jgi:hypothetical protein
MAIVIVHHQPPNNHDNRDNQFLNDDENQDVRMSEGGYRDGYRQDEPDNQRSPTEAKVTAVTAVIGPQNNPITDDYPDLPDCLRREH